MNGQPFDPYAPPRAPRPPRRTGAHRRRWWEVGVRALAVVLGFSLVADPTALPGIETPLGRALGGHVASRTLGVAVLAAGFLPWHRRRVPLDPTGAGAAAGEFEDL